MNKTLGRPRKKITQDMVDAFLDAIAARRTMREAAKIAGLHWVHVNRLRKSTPHFDWEVRYAMLRYRCERLVGGDPAMLVELEAEMGRDFGDRRDWPEVERAIARRKAAFSGFQAAERHELVLAPAEPGSIEENF